jgi:hypothetical protein
LPTEPHTVEQRQMRAAGRCVALALFSITGMDSGQDDDRWDAFVTVMLAIGPAGERRSRFGDKPALFCGSREIAHLEAPGVMTFGSLRADGLRCAMPSVMILPSGTTGPAVTGLSSFCSLRQT